MAGRRHATDPLRTALRIAALAATTAIAACAGSTAEAPPTPTETVGVQVSDFLLEMPEASRKRFLDTLVDGMRRLPAEGADAAAAARLLEATATASHASGSRASYAVGRTTRVALAPSGGPALATSIDLAPRRDTDGQTTLATTMERRDGTTATGTTATTRLASRIRLTPGEAVAVVSPDFASAMSSDGAVAYHVTTYAATARLDATKAAKGGEAKRDTAATRAPQPAPEAVRRDAKTFPARTRSEAKPPPRPGPVDSRREEPPAAATHDAGRTRALFD